MATTHTVTMTGGCPWGFRLYGGDGDPLLVAKLRKRSKADLAGMVEGDILLSINNYSCRGISHGDAMTLVDNAGSSLNMGMLRGATGKAEIDAALVQAESRSQKVGPSALAAPCAAASLVNGVSSRPKPTDSQVSRKQETISDGNTTRHVKTETRTERFGGTTLTKVVREEVSESAVPQPPRFQPAPVAARPAVPVWSPPGRTVTAPSGVKVEKNADESFTMTIGLGEGKENVAPPKQAPPMFNVSKIVTGDKAPDAWQPAVAPKPAYELQQPVFEPLPPLATEAPDVDMEDAGGFAEKSVPHPLHLSRILHEGGSGSDDCCSSPGSPFSMAKRKLFSDSAFYDDPEHKYPTIEEQIKMARKVALSLTAPANVKARGHTMFVKRQERSEKWITDENTTPKCIASASHFTFEDSGEEEKYYNPNPWKPKHTWQATPIKPSPTSGVPPPPPMMPPGMWQAPMQPSVNSKSEKANALSADEFERVRLYEQKSEHKAVSPQLCFNLASDLRNMKGKGGRLFAKRRAKSEKWIVDESPSPTTVPSSELMKRLTAGISVPDGPEIGSSSNNTAAGEQPMETGGIPRNRLAEMIELGKAKCSPWTAAMESPYGNLERAFEHINDYDNRVAEAMAKQQALSALPTAVANKGLGAPTSQSYSKVWSSTSTTSGESKDKSQAWSSTTSQSSYVSSSTSQVPSSRAGFQPAELPSASRYKPVKFNPGASQQGVPEPTQRPVSAQQGVCDL